MPTIDVPGKLIVRSGDPTGPPIGPVDPEGNAQSYVFMKILNISNSDTVVGLVSLGNPLIDAAPLKQTASIFSRLFRRVLTLALPRRYRFTNFRIEFQPSTFTFNAIHSSIPAEANAQVVERYYGSCQVRWDECLTQSALLFIPLSQSATGAVSLAGAAQLTSTFLSPDPASDNPPSQITGEITIKFGANPYIIYAGLIINGISSDPLHPNNTEIEFEVTNAELRFV